MFSKSILIILFVSLCFGEENYEITVSPKPKWPPKYYVKGVLSLPYAQLEEPFEAWFDGDNKRSRIDMYGGVTKTLQRGDLGKYGQWYSVEPWSTKKVRSERTCFKAEGSKGDNMKPQPMLPDITNFTQIADRPHQGVQVLVYQLKEQRGFKMNTYTLYIDAVRRVPVYYTMRGYNTLSHSHYDEYRLQYDEYRAVIDHSHEVFDNPTKGMQCHGFPGYQHIARVLANPMQQYIHPVNVSHLYRIHEHFLKKYKKKTGDDHEERMNYFRHNLRYIHSMNRKNLTYKLTVNHLTDQSPGELRHLNALRVTHTERRARSVEKFVPSISATDIPSEMNWRLYGAVTQVKDQGPCGSCWSFGAVGTIEGTYFRKTGKLLRLSEQQLIDCSWRFNNSGCYGGGEASLSYKYIMKNGGLSTEEDYGHYLAIDGYCHDDKIAKQVKLSGYGYIPSGDVTALQIALYQHGPIAVGIDASHWSLAFYSHGVYYEPKCGNKLKDLNHAVLAVGYGTHEGEPYWLIKNSWSAYWGNDGYFLMSRKDNNCGIATDASYVKMH